MKTKPQKQNTTVEPAELENYLVQQGFFKDEVKIPNSNTAQMNDLVSCARNYIKDMKLNHDHNPLVYLEAITYCILHRSYNDLDKVQQKAINHFAELVAERA
ncbi:hypothetical protein KKG41_03250 [Patescibacteria group bacterium]|nr:hypothetical protein [Patescibacteria group bacterium]MBU1890612.1 hypothetical protein [Patescibacteria group bacterium]